MIKKSIALILTVTLLLSFSSCQKSVTETPVLNETDKIAKEIADSYAGKSLPKINDGKPVTIKVNLGDLMPTLSEIPNAEQPDVFNSTRILQKAFSLIYPNVTIEWARTVDNSSADAFLQYITTQLNSNTAPDIVFAWGSAFAARDWFYDYENVLSKPNPYVEGNKAWREQFPAYIFNAWQVSDAKDRVLGIPLNLAAGTPSALFYNKELFKSLNLEVPKTWEEIFGTCKTLIEAGYVSYSPWGGPGSGNRKINTGLWDVQFSLGPFYAAKQADKLDYNKDGAQSQSELFRGVYEGYYFLTGNDYVKDLWKQVKRKYNECLLDGYENSDYESKWLVGKVGIVEDGLWRYPVEMSNTDRSFEFGLIPPPAVDTNTSQFVNKLEYTEKGPYRPAPTQTFNIITQSALAHGGQGNLDACVAFLQFLTAPDNNNMIVTEQKGKSISFIKGSSIPTQLTEYFNQPFPKVPDYKWPGGFTSAGTAKMSAALELWVKNKISDDEFYAQFDSEFKKDIDEYVSQMKIDVSGYKKGF